MPRRTRDRLNQYADEWATRGIRAWEEGWWEMPITVGNLIAKIIGAGDGEVAMQHNVSMAQSIVAVLLRLEREAQQNRHRGAELSVQPLHTPQLESAGRARGHGSLARRDHHPTGATAARHR